MLSKFVRLSPTVLMRTPDCYSNYDKVSERCLLCIVGAQCRNGQEPEFRPEEEKR